MDDIYAEFEAIMDKGDEKGAMDFIVKNIGRFPESDQDKVITALFEQALLNDEKRTSLLHEFQETILAASKNIEQAREILEKKENLAGIKESL